MAVVKYLNRKNLFGILQVLTQDNNDTKEFAAIASTIPIQPGIYKYFDADNKLLYVGKAKSLRKRVSSYFSKNTYQL
ncbi:MAG: GIY-YIG nuclease family protein [Ferruginibacter sp.]